VSSTEPSAAFANTQVVTRTPRATDFVANTDLLARGVMSSSVPTSPFEVSRSLYCSYFSSLKYSLYLLFAPAGKCKSHGAYAAECAVASCFKQSVSGGLCVRHFTDAQNVFHYAQMSQMSQAMQATQAAQGVQGVQALAVAGLATATMNPMNPTAVGSMPVQMQGMGMPMPMPFFPNQMGLTNQMGMPSQMVMPNQTGMPNLPNQMGMPAQMQMAIPSQMPQMQMGMVAYPVNGLPHPAVGPQVLNDNPPANNGGDAGLSNISFNDEQSIWHTREE
jgi:hypothetical protein